MSYSHVVLWESDVFPRLFVSLPVLSGKRFVPGKSRKYTRTTSQTRGGRGGGVWFSSRLLVGLFPHLAKLLPYFRPKCIFHDTCFCFQSVSNIMLEAISFLSFSLLKINALKFPPHIQGISAIKDTCLERCVSLFVYSLLLVILFPFDTSTLL